MKNEMKKRKLGRTNLEVSEIGLGTTAIGYLYGLGPRDLPSESEAIDYLKKVVALGVNFIDTAPFYQTAEERIGKSGIAKIPGVIVSTKCGHILDRGEEIDAVTLARKMREEVLESLKKLKMDCLELVQVHGGSVEKIKDGSIINAMQKLKDEGKVKFVGISVRGEEAALAAIDSGFFDTIQLAYSILDQRMADRVFKAAKEKNIGVINRSVLMKGALSGASKHLSDPLKDLKKNSDLAKNIAEKLGITLPELAVRFALSNDVVGTVLVGTNKFEHMKSIVEASKQGHLPEDILRDLRGLRVDDLLQIEIKNWPKEISADTKDRK